MIDGHLQCSWSSTRKWPFLKIWKLVFCSWCCPCERFEARQLFQLLFSPAENRIILSSMLFLCFRHCKNWQTREALQNKDALHVSTTSNDNTNLQTDAWGLHQVTSSSRSLNYNALVSENLPVVWYLLILESIFSTQSGVQWLEQIRDNRHIIVGWIILQIFISLSLPTHSLVIC